MRKTKDVTFRDIEWKFLQSFHPSYDSITPGHWSVHCCQYGKSISGTEVGIDFKVSADFKHWSICADLI